MWLSSFGFVAVVTSLSPDSPEYTRLSCRGTDYSFSVFWGRPDRRAPSRDIQMNSIYGALLRHGLSALGGWLVLRGFVAQDDLPKVVNTVSEFAGSAFVAGSLLWSVYRKWKDGKLNNDNIGNDTNRKAGSTGSGKG